jgi:hypothetical protein
MRPGHRPRADRTHAQSVRRPDHPGQRASPCQPRPPRPAAGTVPSRRVGPIMWAVAWAVACGEHRRHRQQWNQPRQPAAAPPSPAQPSPAHEEVIVNSIRRLRRTLARRASSPGRAEPQARQPKGQEPTWPAGQAAMASPGGSSSTPQPTRAWRPTRLGPLPRPTSRRRTMTMTPAAAARDPAPHPLPAQPGRVPGRHTGGQTVRHPRCLSRCQQLDPRSDHAIPFHG